MRAKDTTVLLWCKVTSRKDKKNITVFLMRELQWAVTTVVNILFLGQAPYCLHFF